MKELWIKKTIWRRYLIEDDDVEPVKKTLNNSLGGYEDDVDEIIGDCFDKNKHVEHDEETTIYPVQYEIKES